MKMLIFRSKFWLYAIPLSFFALNSSALKAAECSIVYGGGYNVSVPSSLNIPRDTPIGAEVYRSPVVTLIGQPAISCSPTNMSSIGYYNLMGSTHSYKPSPIGTSGLGWRMITDGYFATAYPYGTPAYGATYFRTAGIALYKIADVDTATVPSGMLGYYSVGGRPIFHLSTSNAITPTVPSCTTPSINVPLGKQSSSGFKGVGTTIGEKAFSIQLNNCPAGINSISYRLDPVNTAFDAKKGILALNPGGATGVGIKITDNNGVAIGLGAPLDFLKNVAAGNYTIPLKAAYYKTSDTVVGGVANASMQFTITYQ